MTIKIMFSKASQFFVVAISNHTLTYWDKYVQVVFGGPIRYLPPVDPEVLRKIDLSRNRIPKAVKELLIVPKDEQAEFDACKTDDEMKDLVIKDAKRNECRLIDLKIE